MFDHVGIFVSDFDKSLQFYEACLKPLGIRVTQRQPQFGAVVFGAEEGFPFLWMGTAQDGSDYYGTPLSKSVQRPLHIALKAPSREAVGRFYREGLAHGGRCNGAPEDCGGGYYGAYLLDFDGNNIEAGIRE